MQMEPRRKGQSGPELEVILTSGKGGAPWVPSSEDIPASSASECRARAALCLLGAASSPCRRDHTAMPCVSVWGRSVHTGAQDSHRKHF